MNEDGKRWFCEIKSDFCDRYSSDRYCDEQGCPSANALAEWSQANGIYGIPGLHIRSIKELIGTEAFQCLNVAYDEERKALDFQSSAVVLDPGGHILRNTEWLMRKKGYQIKVLNLITMNKSHCYNPLNYLCSINDIIRLKDAFCAHTFVGSFGHENAALRDEAEMGLLVLLLYYVYVSEEQRNISLVIHLLHKELTAFLETHSSHSKTYYEYLNTLSERLGIQPLPKKIGIHKNWNRILSGDVKEIISGLMRRLSIFDIEPLRRIVQFDEMDLDDLGHCKTVLYVVVPRDDKRFDFLSSILFSQLFQRHSSKHQKNKVRFLVGKRYYAHCYYAHPVADYSQLLYSLRCRG